MTVEFVETILDTPTGARLRLHSLMPEGRVKAAVQINHGMAEHSARYARLAGELAAAGFAVYAHDHRGHGQTAAPDAPPGVFAARDGFDKVIEDVLAVNSLIRSRAETPVVCFGHSMGSIIALNFALRHPERIAALACWNAGVETGALAAVLRLILGSEAMLRGRNRPANIVRKLSFETWNKVFKPNRTGFDWLSRDEAEVDLYVADPHCGFDISIGLWLDLLKGIYFGADDRNLRALGTSMPVHLLGGGTDPCTNRGQHMAHLSKRMAKAGLDDVTLDILPDTRHESLNEINRDETTARLITWLSARFP